jgi:hypothetical protein
VDLRRLRALIRCTAVPPCRGHEITDGHGAIIPPIGKADRRAGRVTFNAYIGDACEVDLRDRLRYDRHAEPRRYHVSHRRYLRRLLAKLGTEPGPLTACDDRIVQAGSDRAREEDQGLLCEGCERHGTITGTGVRFRQHNDHGFFDQGLDFEPFIIAQRRPDERDVDLPAPQARDQQRRVSLLRRDEVSLR